LSMIIPPVPPAAAKLAVAGFPVFRQFTPASVVAPLIVVFQVGCAPVFDVPPFVTTWILPLLSMIEFARTYAWLGSHVPCAAACGPWFTHLSVPASVVDPPTVVFQVGGPSAADVPALLQV
jgi:hypothetical protein